MAWLEIDTSAFDGKVTQMAILARDKTDQYEEDGVACYLTDKGSVYCSNGVGATGSDADGDAIEGVSLVAPSGYSGYPYSYTGEFSTVKAGTTSSGNPYYWIKVDTSLMEGKAT